MDIKYRKKIGWGLLIALLVVFLQVLIGGITRLTESGLSMTNWDIVTGVFPPVTDAGWQAEFEHYKASPQYKEVNTEMTVEGFKKIYFWEWLHRVWGRWGFVLILLIAILALWHNNSNKRLWLLFGVLLFLYFLQGLLGWFMVMSGLVDMPRVSHYRLTAHLLLALFLFAYLLWFAADTLVLRSQRWQAPILRKWIFAIAALLVIQIAFGGFMSGLRAAVQMPTWPSFNGAAIPSSMFALKPFWVNFGENIATIQFIHRNLGYVVAILIIIFWWKAIKWPTKASLGLTKFTLNSLPVIVVIQLLLGIFTLLLSKSGSVPVSMGVLHQAGALLLLSSVLFLAFQMRGGRKA